MSGNPNPPPGDPRGWSDVITALEGQITDHEAAILELRGIVRYVKHEAKEYGE